MIRMNKLTKWISLLLAVVLVFALAGCGKDESPKKESTKTTSAAKPDMSSYIGTWQGSDHDGENVVHYLICGEDGYWHVYMNRATLKRAVKQLPNQLVSFSVFCKVQNSDHTGCYYEYVKYNGDEFSKDKDGNVIFKSMENVLFTKVSKAAGEPDDKIVEQAKDLFDCAREEALAELEQ